jgi:hypothetical protein
VVTNARRHDDLKAGFPGGPRHGQEMRREEPILGNQIEDFRHLAVMED